MHVLRSLLFAPGSNPRIMQKACDSGADAVIFDLEDAVAVAEKAAARDRVAAELRRGRSACRRYVRINPWNTEWGRDDLAAALASGADGIMLPKAEDPEVVEAVAVLLPEGVDFIPLVETARGVLQSAAIASCSKTISRLAFGAIDFTLDVGGRYSKDGRELLYARSHLVLVSRAADILPPVDTVYPDLEDLGSLENELAQVKDLGMFGKLAIHPLQLPGIHRAFTPSAAELDAAREIVSAFTEAEAQGAAALRIGAKFIDYPVFLKAQRILALSDALTSERPQPRG